MSELVAMVMTMVAAAAAARRFASFSCAYASPVKHAVAACTLLKKQRGNPLSLVLLQWVRRRGGFPSSDDIISAPKKTTLFSDQRTQGISTHKVMAVNVGALLKIDLLGMDVDIDVTVGDNLEEISLEAQWDVWHHHGDGDWSFLTISRPENHVWLHKLAGFTDAEYRGLRAVKAAMPARWCSLAVEAGTCPVHIQSLREGSLNVKTSGGPIKIGDIKGSTATIASSGGSFTAGTVSADSSIKTVGGRVSIKQLVGISLDINTGGGEIVLGSLYGNDVRLESCGGSVQAKHIQAQNNVLVLTEGGSVNIKGLDGNAKIVTGGGSVELQVHEHAGEVEIDASKGAVTLYFSEQISGQVEFRGAQDLEQELPILSVTNEPGVYSFSGEGRPQIDTTSRASRSHDANEAGRDFPFTCQVKILSAGTVYIKKRSWLDIATANSLPNFVK
ncbi:hypothetical protein CY35_07G014800 [Sphagnum magellanicum]|uniref:Uncharacterized protein n=1 Tax=Sphagnum magellanicum TaxID=128215 RepID=A0ACB8HJ08_9BRYO|nr:hypothetical protein CY35_07G014800 [Sphagnum magellanicum]